MPLTKGNYGLFVLVNFLLISTKAFGQDISTESPNSVQKSIKTNPIVINTQIQNYDQPTLQEYYECNKNLDECLDVCRTSHDPEKCQKECPSCPMLVMKGFAIQGVNDTDLHFVAENKPVNTTNIIRLTNEIRNIIDNNMGNISTKNENNINVYQNVSTSGGKFGLGFNQNGSCCIVIRSSRNCDNRRFSTAARCHRKRHRVCGEKCTAKVMHAKRVKECNENDANNCKETIKYVPHRRNAQKCRYTPRWPYVICDNQRNAAQCQKCFQLPYMYVLQRGLPQHCMRCYAVQGGSPFMPGYNPYYSPMYAPPMYGGFGGYPPHMMYPGGYDNDFGHGQTEDDWILEKTKCRRADGTIYDCTQNNDDKANVEGSGTGDEEFHIDNHNVNVMDNENDFDDEMDYADTDYFNDISRNRRQTHDKRPFRHSAYSQRFRNRN